MTEAPDQLSQRLTGLRAGLQGIDPHTLALRTGTEYVSTSGDAGEFRLPLWDKPLTLTYPDFIALDAKTQGELPSYQQALLLYYFITCDGFPVLGEWISFSELPDGRFYNQAYQGYSGQSLVRIFGNDLAAFCQAAESLGGARVHHHGDAAYVFQVLPLVPLMAVYWQGDEDFPPNCQVLFDAAVSHHLPTDACAVIGGNLAKMLIKARS
jgi:hypothetical protein